MLVINRKAVFVCIGVIILGFTLVLSSCENIVLTPEQSRPSIGKVEEQEVSSLPDKKEYEGYVYTIAVSDGTRESFFSSEEGESILESAVVARNSLVESKYGIEITEKKVKESNALSQVRDAQRAGGQFADLLCLPGEVLVPMAEEKLLYNLLATGQLNINSKYLDSDNIMNITANNSLYMLYDSAAPFYDETYVVFCNLNLIREMGLKDPSYLVWEGEWTWERFVYYAETVAHRVVNKESADVVEDIYGYGSYFGESNLVQSIWQSYGTPYFGNTYKKAVEAPSNTKDIMAIIGEIKGIMGSKSRYPLQGRDALKAFADGRLGFLFHKLDYSAAFDEDWNEWCVLPLPKQNSTSKRYYSFVDPYGAALAVPAGVEDPERSIFLLNAFCAASGEAMKKAVLDKYINLFFRNNQSSVTLEIILDSAYVDFAALYGSKLKTLSDISTTLIAKAVLEKEDLPNRVERLRERFETFSREIFS